MSDLYTHRLATACDRGSPRAKPTDRTGSSHAERRRSIRNLDGLRGIAIGLVLLYHFGACWPTAGRVNATIAGAFGLGWAGVDLFFVLSGFLITGILIDTLPATNWWRSFFMRRVLRIFPLYYLAAGVLLFFVAIRHKTAVLANAWWYLTYLSNWGWPAGADLGPLTHFWSLAVEEQFYIVWPLVVLVARGRRLLVVCLALVLGAPLFRWWVVHAGLPAGTAYRLTLGRVDELAMGAALAVAYRDARLRSIAASVWLPLTAAGAAGLIALALATGGCDMQDFWFQICCHSPVGLMFAGVVAGAVLFEDSSAAISRALRAPTLQRLGQYSYGLYVVHYPVRYVTFTVLPARLHTALATAAGRVSYMLICITISAAGAYVVFHLVERPFLRLKDRWAPRWPDVLGACDAFPPSAAACAPDIARLSCGGRRDRP